MKNCKDCNTDISKRGNRATRCESCQKIFRDVVKHISGSGRASKRLYTFWKFLNENNFTKEELQVLFLKRKKECKEVSYETQRILKTEMLIINAKYGRIENER